MLIHDAIDREQFVLITARGARIVPTLRVKRHREPVSPGRPPEAASSALQGGFHPQPSETISL
jgi:hypothetical protein